MHVVLICTSVIVQLHSVLSSPTITDITNDCLGHRTTPFFLTSGIGFYDSKVVMIATEQQLNCTIEFLIMNHEFIFAVIQFPDWYLHEKICIQEETSAVTVSDFNEKNKSCSFDSIRPSHSVVRKKELKINFRDLSTIHTMKIIATSMRDPGLARCSAENEINCVFNKKIYCMHKIFVCDGNINCGVPNSYDEELRLCQGMGVTHFMIFCSILMYIVSLFLLALLFLSVSPRRKETFVYKFDQSLPLFDSENEIITYDIDINVLFPKEKKPTLDTKSILVKK